MPIKKIAYQSCVAPNAPNSLFSMGLGVFEIILKNYIFLLAVRVENAIIPKVEITISETNSG